MTKKCRIDLRMTQKLYDAIQEVAEAEKTNATALILPILTDVFLDELPQKVLRVPVTGWIVDHPKLGNIIIGSEGYDS